MFEYFGHFSKKFLNCTKTVLVAENKDLVIMKANSPAPPDSPLASDASVASTESATTASSAPPVIYWVIFQFSIEF